MALADIQAALAAQTQVVPGVVSLLTTLKTDLDAAIAAAPNPADVAAFQAISDQIGANTTALADAVAANTPAAAVEPAPVEPPVTP